MDADVDEPVCRVRPRRRADLVRCGPLVVAVHDLDGYPVELPDDPAAFLEVAGALGAWVAEDAADVVGHVVLRASTPPPVMAAASASTGLAPDELAVVGRLLFAPRARGRGVGRALLDVAVARAHDLGRQPVLDVVTDHRAAIALYDRAGWRRAGAVTVMFGERTYEELVFIGPAVGTLAP